MRSLMLLCGLGFLLPANVRAQFTEIRYANGIQLRSSDGTIYYHTGEVFIETNGTVRYPKWLGGGILRAKEGFGSFPYRVYYSSGALLAEYRSQLYYPKPPAATEQHQLFNDWSYAYDDRSEWLSTNWRDARSIKHKKHGVMAWNGEKLCDARGATVSTLMITEPLGEQFLEGGLFMHLDNSAGDSLKMQTDFLFDLWRSSYIHPIRLGSATSLPPTFFEDFEIKIETGYWGELVTVHIKGTTIQSRLQPALLPFPLGESWPCPVRLLGEAGFPRHPLTELHPDPSDFVRKRRR